MSRWTSIPTKFCRFWDQMALLNHRFHRLHTKRGGRYWSGDSPLFSQFAIGMVPTNLRNPWLNIPLFLEHLLVVDDCPNRCGSVASDLLVLKKCELHPATAEKMPGLECVRKTKAA